MNDAVGVQPKGLPWLCETANETDAVGVQDLACLGHDQGPSRRPLCAEQGVRSGSPVLRFRFHSKAGFVIGNVIVSRFSVVITAVFVLLSTVLSSAETYKLSTGQEMTGEMLPTTANDDGVQIKVGDGQYQKVPWTSFTQEDLKRFVKNPKLEPFVEPFIEVTKEEKVKKTESKTTPPPKLTLPQKGSLLSAMFGSGVGLFILAALWGATIYAGYEVAIYRAQPPLLVAGLSAIPFLGIAAPIVFLSMPTRVGKGEEEAAPAPAGEGVTAGAPGEGGAAGGGSVNPMQADGAAHPSSLKLAHEEKPEAGAALPETVTFQRGQFTFNRRFFETKFPGFFGVVRRDAEKDMLLAFKTARGHYVGNRITRIAANDLHLQVPHGAATEEVLIPFQEIQQIQLKHKDAK
jgi:hypothetical protein